MEIAAASPVQTPQDVPHDMVLDRITPNPDRNRMTINVSVSNPGDIEVKFVDMLGWEVRDGKPGV